MKYQTIVDILTSTSMINTTTESLKAREFFIIQHFYELKIYEIILSGFHEYITEISMYKGP